jgi:hypothetical protein
MRRNWGQSHRPSGTFASRVQEWGNRHPDLYASRHVVIAIGQTVLGIIGFSALFFGLLPSIPWPSITVDIPLPQVPIPQISLPSLPIPDIAVPLPGRHLARITLIWLEPLFGVLKLLRPSSLRCRRGT